MPVLTLSDIPAELLSHLEERAVKNGRSLEEEAVSVLTAGVAWQAHRGFGQQLRTRFGGNYGSDLAVPRDGSKVEENSIRK